MLKLQDVMVAKLSKPSETRFRPSWATNYFPRYETELAENFGNDNQYIISTWIKNGRSNRRDSERNRAKLGVYTHSWPIISLATIATQLTS